MLVHICCSVDSHYFLRRLREDFANERLIGYFYDPNIHPYDEYLLRYNDVKRSCQKLNIKLLMGEYDFKSWLKGSNGLENEPEKGKRCAYCFDFRIKNSVKKALELGEKSITTTLLMSPKKDFFQLESALKRATYGLDITPIAVDYRKNGGTSEQFKLAKMDKLYHQNYCGCIYALSKQRDTQGLPKAELMSEISGRALFGDIKQRLNLYAKVRECEQKGINFSLFRKYFLNYRLFYAWIKFNDKVVPSYFLLYSNFKREKIKFNIDKNAEFFDGLKDGVVLLNLAKFNELSKKNYKSALELLYHPLSVKAELNLRRKICGEYSQNPIIVIDEIKAGRYEISAKNALYNDSHEVLVID